MAVERRCHLCGEPLRVDVAYARSLPDDGGHRRVYAHPHCYFEEVPEDERAAYQREQVAELADDAPADAGGRDRAPEPAEPPSRGAPPDGETVIDVDGLDKTYPDGTRAVRGVSFTVQRGEIFGLLGPNGAGKSTLIGMLGTLVRPTGGSATVAGFDVEDDVARIKPRLGFAMQDVGVDELATGREFLTLQARLYGLDGATARERATRLLELFGLTDAADKRIDSYSGGMQRRIDLAGALIHEPEILFLDEPTEGLDPRARRDMWSLVERLSDELDATILLSTHYMEEADALCDRLAILDEGEVVVQGTPEALKAGVGGSSIALTWDRPDEDTLARARALLEGEDPVDRARRTDGALQLYVDDPARATPRILRALEAAELAPSSLEIKSASLDDVYLAYTGRSLAAAEREADQEAPA